jgi:N6-adenosine-specific RNA methylase IME4/ParB-like chromosome segregation protein Spo0J
MTLMFKDPDADTQPRHLELHQFADLFPMMAGAEFDDLVADIKAHGVREPIWLYDGKILDGRNRYRASAVAGVDCPMREYVGDDPLAFVLSINLKRRHLNESQRGMVMARIATLPKGSNQHAEISVPSQAQVAKTLNVSVDTGQFARKVLDHGTSELIAAVDHGHLAVSVAAKAAALPAEDQKAIAAKAKDGDANAARTHVKQKVRAEKERTLAVKQMALPNKRYGVIVADPEWNFEVWSEKGKDRAAENHYPTSNLTEIMTRDVAKISADDCVLFLWATAPMLPHALQVMAAWGFEYKSQATWVKHKAGTGYWFRNQHELLLVGTRGNIPAPAPGTQWASVIEAPVGAHSEKPELSLQLIEQYFPTLRKIELNRRGPARPGWDAWGNEAQPTEQPARNEMKTEAPVSIAPSTTMPDIPAFLDRRQAARDHSSNSDARRQ